MTGCSARTSARLSATARSTDLPGALAATRDRYRNRDLAGIVLISDGGNLVPLDHAASSPGAEIPIITVGVGDAEIQYDRELRSVTAGPSAMDASLVDITATIVGHGASGRSQVRLLQGSRVLEVRDASLPADGAPVQLVFPVQPERDAPAVFGVEVAADEHELTPGTTGWTCWCPRRDVRAASCSSREPPASSTPFCGARGSSIPRSKSTRSCARAATIADRTRITFWQRLHAPHHSPLGFRHPGRRSTPTTRSCWRTRTSTRCPRDTLEALADFVGERGGGLLVLGSRALSPQGLAQSTLERVLPLELTDRRGGLARAALPAANRFKVAITPEGLRHPVTRLGPADAETRRRWAALPRMGGAAPLGAARPGASVLAATQGSTGSIVPLIAVQRFGRGRAMIFGGEGSWRWKMMMPAADRTYEAFWRQAARWLASEAPEPVSVTAPANTPVGSAAAIDVSVRNASFEPVPDAQVHVSVRAPGGADRVLTSTDAGGAGRHAASFVPEESGLYRVSGGGEAG